MSESPGIDVCDGLHGEMEGPITSEECIGDVNNVEQSGDEPNVGDMVTSLLTSAADGITSLHLSLPEDASGSQVMSMVNEVVALECLPASDAPASKLAQTSRDKLTAVGKSSYEVRFVAKEAQKTETITQVGHAIKGSMRKRNTINVNGVSAELFEHKSQEGLNDSLLTQTIQNACRSIWSRPLDNLLIHVDLPRLSNRIEIVDELSSTRIFKDEGKTEAVERVRSVIYAIAYYTDGPECAECLIKQFDQYKNQDSDITVWLDSFIQKHAASMPQPLNCLLVLKCINQAVIFPAVFHMKKHFGEAFEYQDVKGSWRVRVSMYSDYIEVRHRKMEKSYGTGSEENFSFVWLITFRVHLQSQTIDVSVSILDYILDKEMKKETQSQILASMQPFLSECAQYMNIWKKPLRKLPVHRDFALLCNRMSIFNYDGVLVYASPSKDTDTVESICHCMLKLASIFSPHLIPDIRKSMKRNACTVTDPTLLISGILHIDKVIHEDSALASVMKCLNATMISPAIYKLHCFLYEKIRYKDVRGSWYVHITLGPPLLTEPDVDGPTSQYRYVSILNRRREQAHSPDPKDQFEFEWILELVLDKEMHIKETNMGIVDFRYGPQTSDETKDAVLKHLSPLLIPPSLQTSRCSVSSRDLLESLTSRFQLLEAQIQQPITCYHPHLPHSLSISSLLLFIRDAVPPDLLIYPKPTHSYKC